MITHINTRDTTGSILRKVNYLIDLINGLLGNTPAQAGVVSSGSLNMAGFSGSVGVLSVSNNGPVYIIANADNFDYLMIRAASGYNLALYDKDEASATSVIGANIKLGNPIVSLDGTHKGMIVLQKRQEDNLWYQVNLQDVYNY